MIKIVQTYISFDPADSEERNIVQEYDLDEKGEENGTIDWETEDGAILRLGYKGVEEASKILNDIMTEYVSRGLVLKQVSDGITMFQKTE
jgi:hypothetical protein